jgi:S-formylglutathione hydrolase FrmB
VIVLVLVTSVLVVYRRVLIFNLHIGGCNIPGEDDSYVFGTGAGFYLDATQEPWSKNYRMFSYITKELPEVIDSNFETLEEGQSIMGHRYVIGF